MPTQPNRSGRHNLPTKVEKVEPLRDTWPERYARHIILKEIGGRGQHRLGQAVVGIVGAGRIGTPLILYLAGAGVGHLVIMDDNLTSPIDPHRTDSDKAGGRALSAHTAAHALNPGVKTTPHNETLCLENATERLASWDLAVLANNRPETKRVLNTAAQRTGKPLLGGWNNGGTAYVTASRAGNDIHAPCLFCATTDHLDKTATPAPHLAQMASGVIGSILAMEALKALLGTGRGLWHTLLSFHPGQGAYHTASTHKNPLCSECKSQTNG